MARHTKPTPTTSTRKGGVRPGAGRPKGSPSKGPRSAAAKLAAITDQIATAEYTGLTPLEYMLSVMRNGKLTVDTRLVAARDAAPYVHARLQSVTLKGDLTSPLAAIDLTPEQYRAIVTDALKKI